jgi:hypothetical protein
VEYYSAKKKNEIMSFAGQWTELDMVRLSEICQTQKDKYHVFLSCVKFKSKKKNINVKGTI